MAESRSKLHRMHRRNFLFAGAAAWVGVAVGARAVAVSAVSGSETVLQAAPRRAFIVDGADSTAPTTEYLDLLHGAGVDCWVYNGPETLTEIAATLEFIDRHSGKVALARSADEIIAIRASGRVPMVIGWQTTNMLSEELGNTWRINPPRIALRAYYELGIRMINLAYNLTSMFGGGCLDPHVGLTKAGRHLVERMQKLGIAVDIGGHTAEQTSLDVLAMTQRPVICSHSNVAALNPNPRNTGDNVIEGIARTGGVFGLTALDTFMTWGPNVIGQDPEKLKRADVTRLADEFDYLKRLVGVDHIGLGPDFTHNERFVVDPARSFHYSAEMSYPQTHLKYATGFEDMSQWPNIVSELRTRGWSQPEIDKVMGENWLRVYREAW